MFSLPETPPGNLALIFSGPLLLIIAAALLSIKTARASHVRFRKAFVVSTQQALSIMLVFLFAAWLGSTYLVIREGSRITHYAARTRQVGELQMYREYMRDSGK